MSPLPLPSARRSWRSASLLLALTVAPAILLTLIASRGDGIVDAAQLDGLLVSPATLGAAFAFYAAWRLSPQPVLGWLTFVSIVLSLQFLSTTGLQVMGADPSTTHPTTSMAFDVIVLLLVAGCWELARHGQVWGDPAVTGLVLGTALAALRLLSVTVVPSIDGDLGLRLALLPAIIALDLAVLVLAHTSRLTEPWIQYRLAGAVIAISGAYAATAIAPTHPLTAGISLGCNLLAMWIFLATALAVLRMQISTGLRQVDDLHGRLAKAEEGVRCSLARLHELNATIAGIVSASDLVHNNHDLPPRRRRALEEMIDAELARLQRLLGGEDAAGPPGTVDLDTTIARLVARHEVRGNQIRWQPTGQQVRAHADAVAEVLSILLDNAAKHGASGAEVEVRAVDQRVEITVADRGPGIPPELRSQVFDWGVRGAASQGQGIGLHIARDLMQQEGGYLEIRQSPGRGAVFVAGLRAAGNAGRDDAVAHVS